MISSALSLASIIEQEPTMPSCEEASDHLAASRTSSRSLNIALLGYRSNPYSGGKGIYLKHLAKALTLETKELQMD